MVFSERLLPKANSKDKPIVVKISHEDKDVVVANPPAKTLITKPVATTKESSIITFLSHKE